MIQRCIAIGLLLLVTAAVGCIRKVEPDTTPSARSHPAIDSLIRGYVDANRFSGTVLIARGDTTWYRKSFGYANAEFSLPFSDSTRFKLHSMSKPITAAAVLKAVEANYLSLDSSIVTYLPQAPDVWREVTIDHLLTHTSGLPEFTNTWLDNWAGSMQATLNRLEDTLAQFAPQTRPGSQWRYSNIGYVLLAAALEQATSMRFADVLEDFVFVAARMSHAGLEKSPPWELVDYDGPWVVPYQATGYNGAPEYLQEAFSKMYVIPGAGGVYASADDVLAFLRQMFSRDLLSDRLRGAMLQAAKRNDVSYGYGWFVTDRDGAVVYRHDGGNNGFVASMEYYPELEVSIIVLSNYGFAPIGEIRASLATEALAETAADRSD